MNKRLKYESDSESDNKSDSSVETERTKHFKSVIKSLNRTIDVEVAQRETLKRQKEQLKELAEDKDNVIRALEQRIQVLTNNLNLDDSKFEELEKELKNTAELVKLLEEEKKQLKKKVQDLDEFSDGTLEDIKMLINQDVASFTGSYEGYLQDVYNYAWTLIQASDFISANIENYEFIKTQCEEDIGKEYSMTEEFYQVLKIPGLVVQDVCENHYFHQEFATIEKGDDFDGKDFVERFVEWVTKVHEKFFYALEFVQMNIPREHKKIIANYPFDFLDWCAQTANKDTEHGLELFIERKNENHARFISEVAKGFDLKRSAVRVLS